MRGQQKPAAQGSGYSFLSSCFLIHPLWKFVAAGRRNPVAAATALRKIQIRVHACQVVVKLRQTKSMEFTGGCVCGGTRYVLKSRPIALADCHCIDCRRSAGAPYVQWGSVPRNDLVLTKGEPRKIVYANRLRSFAACCGTHLFFEDSNDSDMIDVTVASLDDPARFAPQKTIFIEDKLPWVVIDESIPSFQTVPKKPNE